MTDVLTFGECMLALRGTPRVGASVRTSIAGAEAGVAIGLARLGHHSAWAGRVGADAAGSLVTRTLRGEGVETHALLDEAATGIILVEQRPPVGVRVDYHRAGSAGSRIELGDLIPLISPGLRALHVTGVTAALSESAAAAVREGVAAARAVGARVSLDVNFRSRLWSRERASATLRPLLTQVDLVIASADELDVLGNRAADLHEQGVAEVVVKHGAAGAEVHLPGREPIRAGGHAVPAVDVVGAGDAFTAGYLSAWLDGEEPAARLARGNALGAFAVSTVGDWEGLPTRAELARLGVDEGTVLR